MLSFEVFVQKGLHLSKHALHKALSCLPSGALCDVLYQRISKEGIALTVERTLFYSNSNIYIFIGAISLW